MSDDMVAFLRARLDEDAARAAQWHDLECEIHTHLDAGLLAAVAASRMLEDVPGAVCDCGGPARVLRDVEAKRRTITRMATVLERGWDYYENDTVIELAEETLRDLASVYADHANYREEWRPAT